MKRLFTLTLAACLLLGTVGCAPTDPAQQPSSGASQPSEPEVPGGEYQIQGVGNPVQIEGNERLYYQIFVGSFSDSNGDGIGDLRGIINRFDYLNDGDPNSGKSLGIEGIWLNPIFASPTYHKYDATDYYAIDPKFGTEADLRELIALCHSRNVQIILDLVINHTSKQHPWFTQFQNAHKNGDTTSPYYDYYTYVTEKTGGRTYYSISGTNEYYEGNFSSEMPELNFDNPAVRREMVDIAATYLSMGVDGFRFDAAKYVYYGDEPKNAEFWEWYMGKLRDIKPDIYTVAEVWDADNATYPYIASTNCFNFSMSQQSGQIAKAAQSGNVNGLMQYMDQYIGRIREENPNAMPITFVANHDMDRMAGYLMLATGQAKMAANLSILLPGSTFIYYGDEIGILGSRGGSNTDANRRLKMLWGDGDTVKDPVGANYSAAGQNGTVMDQLPLADSLYNHYKKVIAIRQANPEIAKGSFTPFQVNGTKAAGFVASLDGSTVAVLHNATTGKITIDLSAVPELSGRALTAFVGVGVATLEGNTLILEGQTTAILR